MSTFIEGASVHLDDIYGHPATIPTRYLHIAAHYATQSDDGVAAFGLHVFDRDALIGARDLLDSADRCTYADQYAACDELATDDPANPRPRCHLHPKEA